MGRKKEVQETMHKDFNFCQALFASPHQSGADGTCHACHTLDTPLTVVLQNFSDQLSNCR